MQGEKEESCNWFLCNWLYVVKTQKKISFRFKTSCFLRWPARFARENPPFAFGFSKSSRKTYFSFFFFFVFYLRFDDEYVRIRLQKDSCFGNSNTPFWRIKPRNPYHPWPRNWRGFSQLMLFEPTPEVRESYPAAEVRWNACCLRRKNLERGIFKETQLTSCIRVAVYFWIKT